MHLQWRSATYRSGIRLVGLLIWFLCGSITFAGSFGSTGKVWQIPSSQIHVRRIYSYWMSDPDVINHTQGTIYFNDCVSFTKLARSTATDIQFMFASVYPDGRLVGPILPYDWRKSAKPGVAQDGMNCRDHAYENGIGGRWLVGWVNSVFYSDGRMWHAAPPVVGTAIDASSSSGVVLSNPVTYLPLEECVDVSNTSLKIVTHVQIVFRHWGLDHTRLGDDALDIRKRIVPGVILKNNCRRFNGSSDPDVFYYGRELSHGAADVQEPRIFYGGSESTLSARVSDVNFGDGTSWRGSR